MAPAPAFLSRATPAFSPVGLLNSFFTFSLKPPPDLTAVRHLDSRNLHNVNDTLIVLLPKSVDAASIRDYHPISLIHIVGKLFSKVLADRLAPKLGKLV
jgi:hypothetical protein